MRIKTFQSASLSEAFERIKEEMGPNALILSSIEVPASERNGGVKLYEVVAAVDEGEHTADVTPPLVEPFSYAAKIPARARPQPETAPVASSKAKPRDAARSKNHGAEKALREEVSHLKKIVYFLSQRCSFEREIHISNPYFEVYQDLLASEVDPWLACKLVDEAQQLKDGPATPAEKIADRIRALLSVDPVPEKTPAQVVFFGPTGVGKTTTIAKLAARHAMELRRKVLLLTTDTFRIAAFEQLKTYADIIGIPCRPTANPAGLQAEMEKFRDYDTVFIDTTGRSPKELDDLEPWADFFRQNPSVQKNLVLSATAKVGDLQESVDRFGIFGVDKIAVTKIDETVTLGPVLNILLRCRRPVSCLANGQSVPFDLIVPDAAALAEVFLKTKLSEGVA